MSLRQTVQKARNKARNILRMTIINSILTRIYELKKAKERTEKELSKINKPVERIGFRLSQLVESDPDFETKKADLETSLKEAKEYAESEEDRLKKEAEGYEKAIAKDEETIEQYESGEKKVSIADVTDLASRLISGETTGDDENEMDGPEDEE